MAKVNGTDMLVYSNGVVIAYQKECTINVEQDLIDTTNKESAGWEEHTNGTRRATCDFTALYSTTGLSAEDLIAYITSRTSLFVATNGGGYPIIGEASLNNVSINAPMEDASGVSGTFNFDGKCWMLTESYANRMTDPDGTSNDYDTMTVSGISITSAINLAGDADVKSNNISITSGEVFKVITFLTLNSGALPTVRFIDATPAVKSNQVVTVEGLNVITLTATGTATVYFNFHNAAASNFSTSRIYVFKA